MNNYIKFHATMTNKEGDPNPNSFAYQVVNLNNGWRELADPWYTHIDMMKVTEPLAFVNMKNDGSFPTEGDLYGLTDQDVVDFMNHLRASPGKITAHEGGTWIDSYIVEFNDHPFILVEACVQVFSKEFAARVA